MTVETVLSTIEAGNYKFKGSPFYEWSITAPSKKGSIGEEIAESILKGYGHDVQPRSSKEHDRIIDGKKYEIKTAFLRAKEDDFVFYGYDASEDPHFWLLQFVEPEKITLIKMDRVTMAQMYLGRTRKNQMFTTSVLETLEKGGELMGVYEV